MKCVVNWIPLRIRVRSRNTQPHLKMPVPSSPLNVDGYTRTTQNIDYECVCYFVLLNQYWGINERCVCCFVLLNQYWGIVTVPGSFLFRGPGVAGSSPSTLTTSLATPVPSSSYSKGPVDNQGLVPWRLRRLDTSKFRSASLVRVLSDGKISWALGSRGLRSPPPPTT